MAFFAERSTRMSTLVADQQHFRRQGHVLAIALFTITFLVAWYANNWWLDKLLTHEATLGATTNSCPPS
jgi:hypothetical protein